MEQKRLWELVGKKIAGEADPAELEELKRLLEKYPDALYSLELIGHYWKSSKEHIEFKEREAALEKHMQRIREEQSVASLPALDEDATIETGRSKRKLLYRVSAAAAVLLLIVAGYWYRQQPAVEELPMKTLTANHGSKNHFILPDGSKVWLNAGTTVTYPMSFEKDSVRRVWLSGEAYFEIRHDEAHPFWIHTPQMDIRDLGTAFNIKAWPSDETAEATLIEGAIEVKPKHADDFAILTKPNEKIVVYAAREKQVAPTGRPDHVTQIEVMKQPFTISVAAPKVGDSVLAETAWMKDILVFQNETFEELAVRMERWYDITISFENEGLKKVRLNGSFVNETVEQALQELQLIRPFTYEIENGRVVIK